ncbi:hypothetical protein AMTR_s00031p00140170 [Amborella trichopoda]|uniref:Uncharacterized protein n=1 Tax=Amborella trichopoda TaxID=13333 RepID=U5D565_AMBTC|nr:hypothetical protein AMTR_s00031p00140170 [Amborella trichopoda]
MLAIAGWQRWSKNGGHECRWQRWDNWVQQQWWLKSVADEGSGARQAERGSINVGCSRGGCAREWESRESRRQWQVEDAAAKERRNWLQAEELSDVLEIWRTGAEMEKV